MARFDRYMLSQLMVMFGFFSLVLVLVLWINRAVKLFDRLIADGQSAWVFAEFTALSLPNVIRLVLPMAAFAASVYVTNRLSSESELTVIQATGVAPWRLARPVVVFGLFVGLMMAVLTHVLVPASLAQLKLRETEISRNITAKLLSEGTFLHPAPGVTFYIREITPAGQLRDVFLSDRRTTGTSLTYTANEAYLIRQNDTTKLVMLDGLSQNYRRETGRLLTTHFYDFTYDISRLIPQSDSSNYRIEHAFTPTLLRDPAGYAAQFGISRGALLEEIHQRFYLPLLCVVTALIGFATLLVGGFSRFGVWRQIVGALILLILLKLIEGMVADPVRENGALWPLTYVPVVIGLALSAGLLGWSGRKRRVRRNAPDVGKNIGENIGENGAST